MNKITSVYGIYTKHPWDWYKVKKTATRMVQLKEPFDRICFGANPVNGIEPTIATKFKVIVNVSCDPGTSFYPSFLGQTMYWYPLTETGPFEEKALYWFKRVMDYHFNRGDTIYVHCEFGLSRSPTILNSWLQSRGLTDKQADEQTNGSNKRLIMDQKISELYRAMNKYPDKGFDEI